MCGACWAAERVCAQRGGRRGALRERGLCGREAVGPAKSERTARGKREELAGGRTLGGFPEKRRRILRGSRGRRRERRKRKGEPSERGVRAPHNGGARCFFAVRYTTQLLPRRNGGGGAKCKHNPHKIHNTQQTRKQGAEWLLESPGISCAVSEAVLHVEIICASVF